MEVEKDSEEDNEWEKLFDKRTRCVFLLNGVQIYSETIRCKIFKVQDIELLESLKLSLCHISKIDRAYSQQYSKTKVVDYLHSDKDINPNFKKLRQMEIHSICCEIQVFCKGVKH